MQVQPFQDPLRVPDVPDSARNGGDRHGVSSDEASFDVGSLLTET